MKISAEEFYKIANEKIDKQPFPVKRNFFKEEEMDTMYKKLQEYIPVVNLHTNTIYTMVKWNTTLQSTYMKTVGTLVDGIDDAYDTINILPDMFNELPRIKSVGYGEKYSVFDYWIKPELRSRWLPVLYERYKQNGGKVSMYDMREALAGYLVDGTMDKNRIVEPRQGKCTISKGIYLFCTRATNNIMPSEKAGRLIILDVPSAYGDRMLAAMSCNVGYYLGIDPYPDLEIGYKEIIDRYAPDKTKYNYKIKPFELSLLDRNDFNMVVMSPPPHTMEPYGYDEITSKNQSWNMYPKREDWMINFMLASINKIHSHMADNGSFYLTILDRLKGTDTFEVTELILLYLSAIGFEYQHILYWEGGTKGKGTPFWIFKKKNAPTSDQFVLHIQKTYSYVYARLNYTLNYMNGLRSVVENKLSTEIYNVTGINPKYKKPTIIEEMVRFAIMENIYNIIHKKLPDKTLKKVKTVIGRWIMIQSVNGSNNIDPFFPANGILHEQLISNIPEAEILLEDTFTISDVTVTGFVQLFNEAILLTERISNRYKDKIINVDTKNNKDMVIMIPTVDLKLTTFNIPHVDYTITLHTDTYALLKEKHPDDTMIYICMLRYAALGDKGHQMTREKSRFDAYKQKYGVDFEMFGAPFNVHAKYHMSLYSDIDSYFGSYGSFFSASIKKGIFTVNPPNDETFVSKVIDRVYHYLDNSTEKLIFLMGLVLWHDEDGGILEQSDTKMWYLANGKNKNVLNTVKSKYFKSISVVDTSTYKTLDPVSGKTFVTGTERIPILVILST